MIINLTWHIVRVRLEKWKFKEIPPAGNIRLSATTISLDDIDWIPITKTQFWSGVFLPPPKEGVIYITSRVVCEAEPNRCDFYIPNARVWNSWIVSCNSLSPNPYCNI
jgi:hypothetical protein